MIFFKKIFCLGQLDHFGPKMMHFHDSGFAVRIVFKFCPMKRANR